MAEFKVICINEDGWVEGKIINGRIEHVDCDGPAYGEICSVIGEAVDPIDKYPGYVLAKWSRDSLDCYDKSDFLPLDDFKEVTFTEINKEVPVSAQ